MPIIAVVLIGNSSNVAKRTSAATASDFIHVYIRLGIRSCELVTCASVRETAKLF